LIEDLKSSFEEMLVQYKEENKQNINILKKENEKIVSNFDYHLKSLKEKLDVLRKEKP
jgi:hypothetical protein